MTTHTIKATDITIAYPSTGPNAGHAVIHATGCKHTSRKSTYGTAVHVGEGFKFGADDFFHVAPCAR